MTDKWIAILAAACLMSLNTAEAKARLAAGTQSRETLREIEDNARRIANDAETIDALTRDEHPLSQGTLPYLESMRERINRAGRQLRALDAGRASLLPWEQRTLDQVVPLLADAARAETQAIEYWNANRIRPMGAEFRDSLTRLESDTARAARIISDHFKLAAAQASEERMSEVLNAVKN